MNFQGDHLQEFRAESQWSSARFWQSQEKIQVIKEGKEHLYIQQISRNALNRLSSALCKLFRIKTNRKFYLVTEKYWILTDLNPSEKKAIQALLIQPNTPLSEIKQQLMDKIHIIQNTNFENYRVAQQTTELDGQRVSNVSPGSQNPQKLQQLIHERLTPAPLAPPQPSVSSPLAPQRLSLEDTKQHLDDITKSMKQLSAHVKAQSPWLLSAIERLHHYALGKFSLLRYVEDKATSFFKSSLLVPDEDVQDFTTLEEYQPLLTLEKDLLYIEDNGTLDESSKERIQNLKLQLEGPVQKLTSLQAYMKQCDALDATLEDLNEQTDDLAAGNLTYTLETCHKLFQLLNSFVYTPNSDPQWNERMQRKVDYQKQQAERSIADFLTTLSESVKIELDEAQAHLADAETEQEMHKQLKCWETFVIAQNNLQANMETFLLNDIPKNCQSAWSDCIAQQKSISSTIKQVEASLDVKDLEVSEAVNVKQVRTTRPPLTHGKQRAVKQQRDLEAESRYSPAKARALRLFLGYLQVWDMASPVVGAVINPIAKRDYQFYLSAMAKAKQENNPQNYAEAMERARSFWGVDQEFITMYDKHLQGDIQFNLSGFGMPIPEPSPANAGQTPEASPSVVEPPSGTVDSGFVEHVKQLLPKNIGEWIAVFSGHEEGSALRPDATEWERWAYHHIYPQYRDRAMDMLMDRFEQTPPSTPTEDSTPEQNLYFHIYKMYKSATIPELQKEYHNHLAEAQKFSRYGTFTKEWDTFLRGQWKAFTTPVENIPVSTLSLGKALLRKIADETAGMEQEIKKTTTGLSSDSLKQEAQQLENIADRCHDLLQSKPLEIADQHVIKNWLKQVDDCRQEFVAAKTDARGGIFYEQYREHISLEQYQKFLNTPIIPVSNATLAQAFGADFLYGFPIKELDVLGITDFQLQALQNRISILQESFLCPAEQTIAFCKEYLGNPTLSHRIHHPEILPRLQQLERKNHIASALTHSLAKEAPAIFKFKAAQELDKLSVNDSLFFSDPQLGIVYELVKEPTRFFTSYTLRVYSADPRHEIQKSTWHEGTEMLLPYREMTGVYFDSFIDALEELKAESSSDSVATSVKDVYSQLLQKTNGKPSNEQLDKEKLVEVAQNSYYQTLSAMFSNSLSDRRQATRSQFELESKLLIDIEHQLTQAPLAPSDLDPLLLKQAVSSFSEHLIKWQAAKTISPEEREIANEIAANVRKAADSLPPIKSQQQTAHAQFPNSYLAKDQTVPGLPHLTDHVILERVDGGKTIRSLLVPYPQETLGMGSLEQGGSASKVAYSKFRLNAITRQLEMPKTTTGILHLAYLHMRHGNIEAAEALLLKEKREKVVYDPQGQAILERIVQLPTWQSSSHPSMEALKLKALALLLENARHTVTLNFDSFSQSASTYLDRYANYLKAQAKEDGLQEKPILSVEDEKILIDALTVFLHPANHINHRRIVSRMQELGVQPTEDLLLMQNLDVVVDPLMTSPPLLLGDITATNLPQMDATFESRYHFLRKFKNDDPDSWKQLRNFAFDLAGEEQNLFSLLYSKVALKTKIDETLQKMQEKASSSEKLSFLLLKGVLHHPESFPVSISPFANSQLPQEERIQWGHKNLIVPLRTLLLSQN